MREGAPLAAGWTTSSPVALVAFIGPPSLSTIVVRTTATSLTIFPLTTPRLRSSWSNGASTGELTSAACRASKWEVPSTDLPSPSAQKTSRDISAGLTSALSSPLSIPKSSAVSPRRFPGILALGVTYTLGISPLLAERLSTGSACSMRPVRPATPFRPRSA